MVKANVGGRGRQTECPPRKDMQNYIRSSSRRLERKEGREDIFLDINCLEEGDVRPPFYSVSATLFARCPVHLEGKISSNTVFNIKQGFHI